jgi:hypothetical protein
MSDEAIATVRYTTAMNEKDFHLALSEMVQAGWKFFGSWHATNGQGKTLQVEIYFIKPRRPR